MFNQLSGINAILYYLNDIFAKAGFSKVSSDLQAVAIGATNLVATMIAMSVIDRLGRKKLLLVGAVGTAVVPGRGGGHLRLRTRRRAAGLAAGRLHRLLRLLAGRGDLGLPERGLPDARAGQGPEPRQLYALDHERADLLDVPDASRRTRRRRRSCSSRR